jgi:hypothetical protein
MSAAEPTAIKMFFIVFITFTDLTINELWATASRSVNTLNPLGLVPPQIAPDRLPQVDFEPVGAP